MGLGVQSLNNPNLTGSTWSRTGLGQPGPGALPPSLGQWIGEVKDNGQVAAVWEEQWREQGRCVPECLHSFRYEAASLIGVRPRGLDVVLARTGTERDEPVAAGVALRQLSVQLHGQQRVPFD
eukprot:2768016-Rhodomonas_salina.2